jgi:hypothetical protein
MAKKSSKKKSASGKAPRVSRATKEETPPAAAPAADAAAPAPRAPAQADISARAHAIWIARGRPSPGTPLADWLQAERELSAPRR